MYIKDGIVYGEDTSTPIKIESVKVLPDRMMIVTFSSGESRLFDTTTLSGPAFRPLEDPAVFNNPVIDQRDRYSSGIGISEELFLQSGSCRVSIKEEAVF